MQHVKSKARAQQQLGVTKKMVVKPHGKTDLELERDRRVAENQRRMAELGLPEAAGQLALHMAQASQAQRKKRKPQQSRARLVVPEGQRRRSGRVQQRPPVNYQEFDKDERQGTSKSKGGGGFGKEGRRCNGLKAEAGLLTGFAAWDAPPRGWKPFLGCASEAAAAKASAGAHALVKQLERQGRKASVKLMSASQVSMGCWSHVPNDLKPFYGHKKRKVMMLCTDLHQCTHMKDSLPGSSIAWQVEYLPRGHDSGWSGGWRGFAIDQMLCPNDTVVFEVLDNAEFEAIHQAAEAAAKAAQAAETAAAAAADTGAGKDGGQAAGAAGGAGDSVAAAAAGGGGVSEGEGGGSDGSKQGSASPGPSGGGGEQAGRADSCESEEGSNSEQQEEEEEEDGDVEYVHKDVPEDRLHIRAYIFRAKDFDKPKHEAGPEQDEATDVAVEAAGDANGTAGEGKTASQHPQAHPGAAAAAATKRGSRGVKKTAAAARGGGAAAPAAAAAGSPKSRRSLKAKQQQQKQEAAAAQPAAGASKKRSRQQQQEDEVCEDAAASGGSSRSKRARKPTAAAAAAAADAAAKAAKQKGKKPAATAAASGKAAVAGGRKKGAAAGGGGVALVKQPANPKQLVPGPTADEEARDAAGGPFVVERIMDYKVDHQSGEDQFLIRWETFGPWWDSWVGVDCLDQPPHTYNWAGGKKAVPAKFKPMR